MLDSLARAWLRISAPPPPSPFLPPESETARLETRICNSLWVLCPSSALATEAEGLNEQFVVPLEPFLSVTTWHYFTMSFCTLTANTAPSPFQFVCWLVSWFPVIEKSVYNWKTHGKWECFFTCCRVVRFLSFFGLFCLSDSVGGGGGGICSFRPGSQSASYWTVCLTSSMWIVSLESNCVMCLISCGLLH